MCRLLAEGNAGQARDCLTRSYPFAPKPMVKRVYGPVQATSVFIRGGFIDRYSGDRLVFPPVLRIISLALPADFPFHPNWKNEVTHSAFGEIGATVEIEIAFRDGIKRAAAFAEEQGQRELAIEVRKLATE